MNLSRSLSKSQLLEHNLDDTDIQVLQWINERKSVGAMADRLDEKERTVRRRISGLMGRKESIPKKYHKEKSYVERLPQKYSGALKFRLNWRGMELVGDDIPTRNDKDGGKDVSSLPESNKDSFSGSKIRPHWLLSKHEIRGKPENWSDVGTIEEKKQVYTERDFKEMPDGSKEEHLTTYYDGYEVELYENSVVIRIDFPESEFQPEKLWSKYRAKVKEVIEHVEYSFGIELVGKPVHVEACMRGQHWANVDSTFANWVWDNKESVGDDSPGIQFHVYDQDEDLMALVDASHGDPEFEWVHGQEAKNHMSNMKDLIMWGGYYEVKPTDFKSLAWFRDNVELFENVLERIDQLDELESRLDDLRDEMDLTRSQVDGLTQSLREMRSRINGVEEDVESLSVKVSGHDAQIEGHAEQIQNNRDEFYERMDLQDDRIRDAVQRVDSTYQEVQENEDSIRDLSGRIDQHEEVVQSSMQGLEGKVNHALSQNQELHKSQEEILMELKAQRESTNRKLDELTELNKELVEEQKKGFFGKFKEEFRKASGVVSTTVMSIF